MALIVFPYLNGKPFEMDDAPEYDNFKKILFDNQSSSNPNNKTMNSNSNEEERTAGGHANNNSTGNNNAGNDNVENSNNNNNTNANSSNNNNNNNANNNDNTNNNNNNDGNENNDQNSNNNDDTGPNKTKMLDRKKPRKVLFYKNGDRYFVGKNVTITPNRYFSFRDLMNDLNKSVDLPYGVRRVYTPVNGHEIYNIDELHDGSSYVCASFEPFRPTKYGDGSKPWNGNLGSIQFNKQITLCILRKKESIDTPYSITHTHTHIVRLIGTRHTKENENTKM